MHQVGPAMHLDDRGLLPAVDQNAHRVADLESPGSGSALSRHLIRSGSRSRARLKRRRRWRNFATMRVGLRFGRGLRVAFRRKQSRQLYAERFAALECLSLFVVLIIAGARSVVARKNFEALSVVANVDDVHLQSRSLRKGAGHRQNQKQNASTKNA